MFGFGSLTYSRARQAMNEALRQHQAALGEVAAAADLKRSPPRPAIRRDDAIDAEWTDVPRHRPALPAPGALHG